MEGGRKKVFEPEIVFLRVYGRLSLAPKVADTRLLPLVQMAWVAGFGNTRGGPATPGTKIRRGGFGSGFGLLQLLHSSREPLFISPHLRGAKSRHPKSRRTSELGRTSLKCTISVHHVISCPHPHQLRGGTGDFSGFFLKFSRGARLEIGPRARFARARSICFRCWL